MPMYNEAKGPSLRLRIHDFLARLKSVRRTRPAVFPMVRREAAELRANYAAKSLPMCFSDYRIAIQREFGPHPAADMLLSAPKARVAGLPLKYCCGLTGAEVGALKRDVRRRVINYQRRQLPIANPSAMLLAAVHGITNPPMLTKGLLAGKVRWYTMLTALVLLTGRRPVELGVTGTLTLPKRSEDRFTVIFEGQAKTRHAPGTRQGPYPIRTLAPASVVVKAWKLMKRSMPRYKDGDAFHPTASKEMFIDVRRMFPGYKAYDLRAVNGRLTYHLFAPAHMTDLAWFMDQFGHTDTITSAFYQRYYLPHPQSWKRSFWKLYAASTSKP